MAETIRLTVDGVEVEVEKGASVIQAAFKAGVAVPHYCYHPGLTVAGNCRMCLVEIEKMPKLVTSCTTQAADGMKVFTRSEKVRKGVAGVEEFLLANHPLDCPICDQAGECRLQDYSYHHGTAASRFREEKLRFKKGVEVGPHVVLDCERCIMCTRCVRFCDEITKTGELGVFQRGLRNEIGIFPGRSLDNAYSGNVVDLCPVGALTLKEFRFRRRVWFIRDVPSVCGGCANGCNVNLGTGENRIWRLTPRENPMVNGWWICDEGRLSHRPLYEAPRLGDPQTRAGAGFQTARLAGAAAAAAERLRGAAPGSAAAVASASLTVEDLWVLRRLGAEVLPGLRVVVPERRSGEDDGFLIKADRTPNRRGATLLGFDVDAGGASSRALMADVAAGKVTTLLVIGEDAASLPGGSGAIEALRKGGGLLVVDAFETPTAAAADVRIPAAAFGEFDGTWVNAGGRAQRVRRAVTPRAACLPVWQTLCLIASKLGAAVAYGSAAEVLRDVAAKVPEFSGASWTALGAQGMQVAAAPAGSAPPAAPMGLPAPARAGRG